MKKNVRYIFNMIALFTLTIAPLSSCSNDSVELRKGLESMIGHEIIIPCKELTPLIEKHSNKFNEEIDSTSYTYVSYLDVSECSPCYFSKLNQWDEIQQIFESHRIPLKILVVIEPNGDSLIPLINGYESNGCQRPVFVDTDHVFKARNPFIPHDSRMHTFLLNPKHQVVFVGDPIRNRKINKLQERLVKELSHSH